VERLVRQTWAAQQALLIWVKPLQLHLNNSSFHLCFTYLGNSKKDKLNFFVEAEMLKKRD
jgi:hypothetical protein